MGAVFLGASAVAAAAPTPGGLGAIEAALVAGLTGVGMRWGATDFGPGASGDIMHFDCEDCL